MEDRSQGSGRNRPPSSNSAHTRMTPTSSNSSSAHLPARASQNNGTARGPSSSTGGASLLHERLRERKVESARQSRRRSVDLSTTEMGPQSSPTKGPISRSGTNAAGKGMGVKQVEEVGYMGTFIA